jgi:pre-mRNA-processing factor 17
MDLLGQYGDDDDDDKEETTTKVEDGTNEGGAKAKQAAKKKPFSSAGLSLALPAIEAAPDVDLLGENLVLSTALNPSAKKIFTNPTFALMNKPMKGPVEIGQHSLEQKFQNHQTGHVEKLSMSQFAFDKEYLQFHNFGFAANPARVVEEGRETLVSTEATPQWGKSIWDKANKRRRVADKGDDYAAREVEEFDEEPTDLTDGGKWGGFVDEALQRREIDKDMKTREDEVERQKEEEKAVEGEERETKERVTSVFHGQKETDFQGRSWLENKTQLPKDVDERQCFLPKKWIHTWSGHTMGVQAIRWFPKSAHLLLSAGMDAKIKIWDYHNQRKCLRDYMGHDQAVRDINFTDDGRRFYSVSYDKNVQYWDTETGQIISTFTNKKTPFCVAVHPDPSQQNVIVTGCSNKKAVQWDANSCSIVQEYDEHLGAVNSVTFCEEGKRILTTSDDKKIFLWEYGIPVVVKHIAEPTMHSVPAVCMSPDKKYLIGQAMDNKIICYEAFGRFKFQGRKTWKGHICAGYAIQPGFSSDGRWIMSGDTDGKIWFWDWAKQKNYRVLKAHDGVCIGCLWHPNHMSRVVTCGWDGAIKLWD